MPDDLTSYLDGLVQLAGLPADRERALAEAQRAGQDDVDRALAAERRVKDTAEKARKQLSTVEDGFRRLEARTGPVEAEATMDAWADLAEVPGRLEALLRDLESAAKAQDWVERTRGQLTRPVPTPQPPPIPVHSTEATQRLPAQPVPAPERRPVVLWLAVAFILVLAVSLAFLLIPR